MYIDEYEDQVLIDEIFKEREVLLVVERDVLDNHKGRLEGLFDLPILLLDPYLVDVARDVTP